MALDERRELELELELENFSCVVQDFFVLKMTKAPFVTMQNLTRN
jgi:hypothetical protein